jgi:hypothetical protein
MNTRGRRTGKSRIRMSGAFAATIQELIKGQKKKGGEPPRCLLWFLRIPKSPDSETVLVIGF